MGGKVTLSGAGEVRILFPVVSCTKGISTRNSVGFLFTDKLSEHHCLADVPFVRCHHLAKGFLADSVELYLYLLVGKFPDGFVDELLVFLEVLYEVRLLH